MLTNSDIEEYKLLRDMPGVMVDDLRKALLLGEHPNPMIGAITLNLPGPILPDDWDFDPDGGEEDPLRPEDEDPADHDLQVVAIGDAA